MISLELLGRENQDQTCPDCRVSLPASSRFALSQLPWVPGAGHAERGGGESVQLPTHLPGGYDCREALRKVGHCAQARDSSGLWHLP